AFGTCPIIGRIQNWCFTEDLVEGVACIGFVFVYQAVVVSCFHDFHLFESAAFMISISSSTLSFAFGTCPIIGRIQNWCFTEDLVEGVACIGFVFVYQAVVVSCFHDFHLFELSLLLLSSIEFFGRLYQIPLLRIFEYAKTSLDATFWILSVTTHDQYAYDYDFYVGLLLGITVIQSVQ
ncbi:hypothetical protein L9F63_011499, partial [Diploptera punctata]